MADALDLPKLPSPADYEDVGASGTEAPAENKESIFAGILETLQHNNFLLMNLSESADEIEENTESDEGETEKRNRRINEENTDKKGVFSKAIGGLGAGVKGVGGILNKANPFQEGGLGTKMSILLISGVLFAISKFGDKLVKPLAAVLEMFDGEGGVLEKIKNSEIFKGIVDTFETMGEDIKTGFNDAIATFTKIKDAISGMGINLETLLEAVTTTVGFIQGAYDSVMEYINSFDTQGSGPRNEYADGKLDAFEIQNLKDDLVQKAKDLVTSIIGTIWNEISFFTKLAFATGGVVSLMLQGLVIGKIAKLVAGVSGKSPKEGPPRRSARGNLVKGLAKSLVVGTSALSSSVGATTKTASLKPGQAINKAGSIYDTKSGKIVKTAAKLDGIQKLSKYPRMQKLASRIPLLLPILTAASVLSILNNDELSKDEKSVEVGGALAGGLGAAGFAAIGATLGSVFPGPGTIAGGIIGSLVGYGLGDFAGRKLAEFLLDVERQPLDVGSMNTSTLGEMNATTGTVQTVENLPIQIMSASTGEYPQSSFVSQLDGNLMNRNTDLALAAYEADKAKELSTSTPLPGGRDTSNTPLSMPVVIDKGQVTNIQSNYGSRLNVDNGNSTSRLFGDSLLIDIRGSLAGGF